MKKVLLILPSLRGGGAERVMVTLLKYLDRNKFDLHLALISKEGPYLAEVPDDVPVYDLEAKRVRYAFIPMLKLIRKLKPEVVISTLGHLNLSLIMLKWLMPTGTRLFVRQTNIISESLKLSSFPVFWRFVYSLLYKRADCIICQSDYMKDDLVSNLGVPEDKIVRVYNPVDIKLIRKRANSGENPFFRTSSTNLIAVGRLNRVKGYDRLLNSMPDLLKLIPNAKLWIIGEGELEEELKEQCNKLGLNEKVRFVGFQENPYVWMKYADLFVLSSYHEGLPNVLLEAIACNCPVVVLDHPGGTREIMERLGLNNRLRFNDLNYSFDLFNKLDEKAYQKLNEVFGIDHIVKEYERLFQ